MGKNRSWIIIILILVIYGGYHYLQKKVQLYGDDKPSIIKVIQSIDGYNHTSIQVLGYRDFKNVRVAGFLSDDKPGYIQFYKNKDGHYKWQHIEVSEDDDFGMFLPDIPKRAFMFVTNEDNTITEMHVTVNGEKLEKRFAPHQVAMFWLDFPHPYEKEYAFLNYQFFDEHGKLISGKH